MYILLFSLFTLIGSLFLLSIYKNKNTSITPDHYIDDTEDLTKTIIDSVERESDTSKQFEVLITHILDRGNTDISFFFVYSFDKEKNYYIQAVADTDGMHAEIVRNDNLHEDSQLNDEQIKNIVALGWQDSTKYDNFTKSWSRDEINAQEIAQNFAQSIAVYEYDTNNKPDIDIGSW